MPELTLQPFCVSCSNNFEFDPVFCSSSGLPTFLRYHHDLVTSETTDSFVHTTSELKVVKLEVCSS